MTLYFETPVNFPEPGSISVNGKWHLSAPLLAVASFSQERGGFIVIFDELGEPLKDLNFPVHRSFQVTAIAWHPEKTFLATGWENGELKVWMGSDKDFTNVAGPHKTPITLLEFSEKGGRLVSCDSSGSVVGWKIDSKGQVNTVFHLDLKETITHLTFRLSVKAHPDFDVEGLAKAAVNGDERALDMFSNWRPKTTARRFRVQDGTDNLCFFVATQPGSIYYVNSSGSCAEVLNTEGVPLSHVVYHTMNDALVVMMEGLTIGHFAVDHQGRLTELAKVKLSGRTQNRALGSQALTWAGSNSLAILTGDLSVRIWDIETNDNYILPTTMKLYTSDKQENLSEIFTCVTFSKLNQTLCAGTNVGRIYFWTKNRGSLDLDNPEDYWELHNVSSLSGTIKQLMWGSVLLRIPLLSVNCVTNVYIMKEQSITSCFGGKIWATQKTADQILVESSKGHLLHKLEVVVSDMTASDGSIVFTNGKTVVVYEILWKKDFELNSNFTHLSGEAGDCDFSLRHVTSFPMENEGIALFSSTIIGITPRGLTLRSLSGTTLTPITMSSTEGEPIGMDISGNFLTVFTIEGYVKLFNLSTPEIKTTTPARNIYELVSDFGEIIQARSNVTGSKLALTIAGANLIPDGKLYVWDVETDELMSYDFRKYKSFDEDEEMSNFDEVCNNRVPLAVVWDAEDPRLLICDAKKLKMPGGRVGGFGKARRSASQDEKKTLKDEDHILVTMFVSSEHGIRIHDIRPTSPESRLLSTACPFIILLDKLTIVREVMSDFTGIEDCDKVTRTAILDFSYNLTIGNMDAAFKSIKLVQSTGVWASLAKMCVKNRRLDVAGVCLGHMGNAKAARGLRLAQGDASLPLEAKVAVLAVHLGMLDEAEQLYIECNRYDLLNKLLRSRNKMDAAHAIAESKDRIHLRNTEHAWGKALERAGLYKEAGERYEKANTHRYDIPRMLTDHPQHLQAYMSKTKDSELLKWWGQFIESQGDMTSALKIYAQAGDVYSQVRVLCFMGEEVRGAELARGNTDKAAFYHMARYYETVGNYEDAIGFFTKASAYSNAVRLCKENHMAEELWNLGFVVSTREKLECARYFEEGGDLTKAVVLYHRAGMLHKALDLAFKTQQFDVLQQIATDLDSDSDPAIVEKCAQFFVNNEQFDKAVDLLAIAKKYEEAITLCLKHNVQLTEDLAEKLTPDKDAVDEETRIKVLENLAESLMLQGDYHLATKKFTQSGDKIRAMKALLKSGDTDKIVFYAGVSRQREIYIMAANYLQSLDWQNQPEVLRNIINFYSRGKALDLLANFYVACAQVEIDEFQNYEKALGALTEASRSLSKITVPKEALQHQKAMEIVQQRLTTVKRFVDIRRLFERGDLQAGLTQCKQLLMIGGQDLEAAVRRGDIYALMIQHCVKLGNFAEAKQLCGELKQFLSATSGQTPITYYLNKEIIEALAQGLGVSVSSIVPPGPVKIQLGDEEEAVEEVIDE